MVDKNEREVTVRVSAVVKWLEDQGIDNVIVGVNAQGYYCCKSNISLAMTSFLLREAETQLFRAAEAQREKSDKDEK